MGYVVFYTDPCSAENAAAGKQRFSHEASAKAYAKKMRQLGYLDLKIVQLPRHKLKGSACCGAKIKARAGLLYCEKCQNLIQHKPMFSQHETLAYRYDTGDFSGKRKSSVIEPE